MTSLTSELYRVFDQLRAGGVECTVQRSDFVTRLAVPLVRSRWAELRGRAPLPQEALTGAELSVLAHLLQAREDPVRQGLVGCTLATTMIADEVRRTASSLPAGRVSERVAVWVKQELLAGREPDRVSGQAFAQRLLSDLDRPTPLSRQEFERLYAATYDREWDNSGAANLLSQPPSEVRLGADVRPHLVAGYASRQDWSQGTNRPVYQRYRLYFKASATATPSACPLPECHARHSSERGDLGLAEVQRACGVFGLQYREHHQIIRSLALGLTGSDETRWPRMTWSSWAEPCRPISLAGRFEPNLAQATASAVSSWIEDGPGRPMVNRYGRQTVVHAIAVVAIRKAWMGLLGHERGFALPMRRCGVPRLVRTALYRHGPSAIADWVGGRIDADPDDLPEPLEGVNDVARGQLERENATFRVLAASPDVARRILQDASDWQVHYEFAVAQSAESDCLSATEAYQLVRALKEEMDDD